MRTVLKKSIGILGTAAGLLVMGAGVASAHVTVAAPGVTVGQSDAAITFRVPDESATASTVSLKVQLPTDQPIAGVLVAPVTGWTARITNTKLAKPLTTDDGTITEVVSEIDWTADAGAGIKPGFFGQFTVIAGQLPDGVSTLTFKAIQTYSDNKVVSWIELPAAGSTDEPEHPAPKLTLLPASSDSNAPTSGSATPPTSSGVSVTATPEAAVAASTSTGASQGAVTTAIVIGIVGVLVGAAGVGLALGARRRPDAK